MEGVSYKAGGGSLMCAMVATRANVAFAVSTVSQFMSKASPPHWMVIKQIMRYLKGTLDFKLCLGGKDITLREDFAMRIRRKMQTTSNPSQDTFFFGIGVIL